MQVESYEFAKFMKLINVLHEHEAVGSQTFICLNCWELVSSSTYRLEHLLANHQLSEPLSKCDKLTLKSYLNLCRLYGKCTKSE